MMLDTRRKPSVAPALQSRTLRIAGGFGVEIILGPYDSKAEAQAVKAAIEDFAMSKMRKERP